MVEKAGKGKAGALNSAEIVKHEAMEAYGTSQTGKSIEADSGPHKNNDYSGLFPEPRKADSKQIKFLAISNRPGGTYTVTKSFDGGVSRNNVRTGNITRVTYKPDR
jgi:hypothetical protein